MRRLSKIFGKVLSVLVLAGFACSVPVRAAGDQPSVPYVPTPQAVVERMLAMAKVTAQDYLIDLGSGDGRIVVTAARKYGARGFGVDLNPVRIDEANANARKNGVTDKVAFYQRNLFDTDLSQATVITMYLLPRVNLQLRPKLLDLKPGTRLVSHDFDMGDWKADQSVRMDATDKYSGAGGDSDIYFWVVPAKAAGAWRSRLSVAGKAHVYEFSFEQKYQMLSGTARVNGRPVSIRNAQLDGAAISFVFTADLDGAQVKHEFSGRVDGDRVIGEAGLSGGRLAARVEWIAERAVRVAALAHGVTNTEAGN
ncbi:MAG: class I SAM-dependent methyltransferase [Burkholderiales bacterium]|nr:class I SAM-dependent methyltransferase [Burkholderiales bacterium]